MLNRLTEIPFGGSTSSFIRLSPDETSYLIIRVPAVKHLLQIFQGYGGTASAITAFYAAFVTID